MKIRVKEDHWNIILNVLNRSFGPATEHNEWGIIGIVRKLGDEVFLITDVIEANDPKDVQGSRGNLRFSPNYIRRAQLKGKKDGATGLIFFHTHPFSKNTVSFSPYDDAQEPELMKNLCDVWPGSEHVSVVLGERAFKARAYLNDGEVCQIPKLFVVGKHLKLIPTNGVAEKPAKAAGIFDRAKVLTGNGALAVLGQLRMAIIGAGGTGSLMVELLKRAGAKDIVLIDDDCVDDTNLNRLLHATALDAKEKRKKVYVAVYANHLTGIGCVVEPVDGSIINTSIQERLKQVDLLIGCVDKETPRYILNKIAVDFGIPYVDLGVEIGGDQDLVKSLDARVTHIYPGGPCLECLGLINHDKLRLEGLQPEERKRHIALGYSQDIDIKQPAVMELNMRAASLASLLIRHMIQPFLDESLKTDMRESLLTLKHRQLAIRSDQKSPCRICGAMS